MTHQLAALTFAERDQEFSISCRCGWERFHFRTELEARTAFEEHRLERERAEYIPKDCAGGMAAHALSELRLLLSDDAARHIDDLIKARIAEAAE